MRRGGDECLGRTALWAVLIAIAGHGCVNGLLATTGAYHMIGPGERHVVGERRRAEITSFRSLMHCVSGRAGASEYVALIELQEVFMAIFRSGNTATATQLGRLIELEDRWCMGSEKLDRRVSVHANRFGCEYIGYYADQQQSSCVRVGWPLASLCTGAQRTGVLGVSRWSLLSKLNRPVWMGLVVNTMVYSLGASGSILLASQLRRFLRSSRGRCASCGHTLGRSARCTECGMGFD